MTMCKHGIGQSYCAICKGEKLLPKCACENIGFDCVKEFKVAGWIEMGKAMTNDVRRCRNEQS